MRESFIFYRSFFEAISDLPDEAKGRIFCAISDYALNETPPILEGLEKAIFTLIKPQLDANNKRYENGKNGGKHGVKGGRPKNKNPKETPKKPQDNPTRTPNDNVNANENVNVNDKDSEACFNGKVIRLNKGDFGKWVKMTGWTEDYLWKVLDERDDWYADNPAKAGNWFISTSKFLQNSAQS